MPHTWETDAELLAQTAAAFEAKKHERISLALDIGVAWILLGQLQLALSHPANANASADVARGFANQLAERIATTNAEKELVRRGWGRTQ